MRISGTIKGTQKLIKQFKKLESDTLGFQIKAVQDSVFLIHETAVKSIQDNSGGYPQRRWTNGRSRWVLASYPGDPPNTDTGRLVQSIKFDFKNRGLTGRVGTNLRYGAYLEFGTSNMAARPWLAPAIRETSKSVAEIFRKALKDATNGI
jgi:HK97 gp10 family phage protein